MSGRWRTWLLVVTVAALGLAVPSAALAGSTQGMGKDSPGGPYPLDPTACTPSAGAPAPLTIAVGSTCNGGTGVAVAIGDEGVPNSVGRASVSVRDNGKLVSVYWEEYLNGNPIDKTIEKIHLATHCILKWNGPCQPANSDATLFTVP